MAVVASASLDGPAAENDVVRALRGDPRCSDCGIWCEKCSFFGGINGEVWHCPKCMRRPFPNRVGPNAGYSGTLCAGGCWVGRVTDLRSRENRQFGRPPTAADWEIIRKWQPPPGGLVAARASYRAKLPGQPLPAGLVDDPTGQLEV